MSGEAYSVLFLCTGNSTRSIIAETMLPIGCIDRLSPLRHVDENGRRATTLSENQT